NWDAIWEAASARTPAGWSAEILIPLKSLLFRPGLKEWGFNVQRRIQRRQETDRWASADRDIKVTQTSRAGLLTELPIFGLGLGLSVRPSVTGGGAHDSAGMRLRDMSHASLDVTQRLGADTLATTSTMAVVRVKQNVLEESSVGFIATAGDPLQRRGSWLVGPDLTYQTSHFRGDKNFLVGLWGMGVGREDLKSGDRIAAGF